MMTAERNRTLGIFTLALLALVLAGCQTGAGGDGPGSEGAETQPSASDTGMSDALAQAEAEQVVAAEQRSVAAEAEYQAALRLVSESDYRGAELALLRVLELDDDHYEAQAKLADVRRILGKDTAGPRSAFGMLADEQRVKEQQIAIEVEARINAGQSAFDSGDYEKAEEMFAGALEIIRFQPFYHDLKGQREEATQMLERSKMAKREASLAREENVQREASRMRMAEEQARTTRDADRIRTLFEKGNAQFRRGNYTYARKVFDEIVRLDPTNDNARRLRDTAREALYAQRRDENLSSYIEEWRRTFEEHKRSEVYQADVLVWPDEEEWLSNVATRKPRRGSAVQEAVSPEDSSVWSRLRGTTVNIDFQETPLEQVRSYLQEVSGVNMIVDPTVWEEMGDEIPVTISLQDMALDNALNIIMQLQDLAYRVENGVLIIATPSETSGDPVLSLYDVRDLTGPLQDFPGPNIELATEDDDGGFGISISDDEPVGTIGEDELVTLIEENVFPESWEEEGRTLEIRNKTLVARTTPEVHREIEKLLGDLRQSGGILVTVESRFLTTQDNFLESLGVDWRGLGDQGLAPPSVGTGTTTANFDDFLVGIPNAPSPYQSIGADNTSGLFYDDGQDGDLRARVENIFDQALGDSRVLTDSGGISLQLAQIDDAELEAIIRAVRKNNRVTLLTAPAITTFNTQRAHVLVVNQIAYIRDYDVEVAQRAAIADPIIGTIQDGLVLDVRPIVSSDRRFVTMELRPTVALLHRPIEVFETTLATGGLFGNNLVQIQIPELTLQKVRTTVTVPDGGTIMIGGLKTSNTTDQTSTLPILRRVPGAEFLFGRKGEYQQRENLVVLIKAKITSLSEQEPQPRLNAY